MNEDTVRVHAESARLPLVKRGEAFTIMVDGQSVTAYPGETIAAVLLANGIRDFNPSDSSSPHGIYCGIGRCFSCLVRVDGRPDVRACVTPAQPGMHIQTHDNGEE